MQVRGFSHAEAWLRALGEVAANGRRVSPRGMGTREIPWVQIEVSDPMTFPLAVSGREFRDVIGLLEGLQLVGEFSVPELLGDRVRKFRDFQDGGIMWGAYGARTHGQLGNVVELLKRDPDSRQAVMSFFDASRDLGRDKRDIPCTISAQFLLREMRVGPEGDDRDLRLDLGISMRSNDLWLGTPYDMIQFSILQASVAQALGVRVGRYIHRVGSLHLYDRDAEKAEGLEFKAAWPMAAPLFSTGDVQSAARRLALDEQAPLETQFEEWAYTVLYGG